MDDLRIPVRRVAVEVAQTDGSQQRFQLFVSEHSPHHEGPETPSEAITGVRGFVPAINPVDDSLVCLKVDAIMWMRVKAALERPGPEADTIPTEHDVEIVLSGGERCSGLLSYVRPEKRDRLSDFLNEGEGPLKLIQGDEVVLVNRRHVLRVVCRRT